MNYFQDSGRRLLAHGYLITPIKPGHKRPALTNWQNSRMGAGDLFSYPRHGVGVLCGQGANPIVAIDIDTTNPALAQRFSDWCHDTLGPTVERVGCAPKTLLVYRAAEAGWGKVTSPWFIDQSGIQQRLEILGNGQQFVAYHEHPDTRMPYEWTDIFGGLEYFSAKDLSVITEQQIETALATFVDMAEEAGLIRKGATAAALPTPKPPTERTAPAEDDFFGRVNAAAMASLDAWVPALLPAAREYQDGFRVSSVDLGRDLEEDLSIVQEGIVDFGVADMGDARQGKRTPIDLVLEWAPQFMDLIDAPLTPFEAAIWLCECLEVSREELGYGLRSQKKKNEARLAKRAELETLLGKIDSCDDELALMDEIAVSAREVLKEAPELLTQVVAAIKSRFKTLTGLVLPSAELSKVLRGPSRPTVREHRPLTEFGNAERMLDKYGQGLMYVPELQAWFCWTGICWRRTDDVEIEHLAKETVKALVGEMAEHPDQAEFFKFCAISQKANMIYNMVFLARSDPRVMCPAAELDKHTHLVGAQNGVIDLRTGKLLPPDPELRITKMVGCDYDPQARAPLFEQTVLDVFNGDADTVGFFQRLVGYAMSGNPKEDVLVIPHGNGSNGKSTVLGAVRRAFGDYARGAEAETFVSDGSGGSTAGRPREDLLRLKGARFIYVNEPDENSELREGSVKAMTGGDILSARGIHSRNTVEFLPSWVVFMPTNHKPIIKGSDNGIWRRLMLLPFTRNFEDDPTIVKDPQREEKLAAELPGILTWIVTGTRHYTRVGLQPVGAIKAAREAYREQMDLLSEWLETCCEVGQGLVAESSALWASWAEFAKNRGLLAYVKNNQSLGRRLEARFPSGRLPSGKRIRMGLRVRDDFDLV